MHLRRGGGASLELLADAERTERPHRPNAARRREPATIVDGWLRTGDLGRMDAEGFVYVEDRAKDLVLRGGENVYSAEVEAAIYEHPAVHEAAVYGVPHEQLPRNASGRILKTQLREQAVAA